MRTIFLRINIIFTLIFCLSGFSQNIGSDVAYLGPNLISTFDKSNKTVKGSPYINSEFVAAKISINDQLVLAVRYNAISDEFEVKKDDKQVYLLNKSLKDIQLYLLNEKKTYQLIDYVDAEKEGGSIMSGYFVHLGNPNNNIKFLKKEQVKFYEEKKATSSYDQTKPAEFKRKSDDYYVKIGDAKPVKLSSDKKDLAEMFPKQKEEILDYIKSEKLKLNNEDDFTKLSVFINLLK